jgi:aminopeptidase N
MRGLAILILFLLVPAGLVHGRLPLAKGTRTRKVDIKHLAIDLRCDWQKKKAYGTTSVTFTALAPTNLVTLDAGMLSIDSVTRVNGPSLKFDYDGSDKNDNLQITLDRTYHNSAEVTIRISYSTNHVNRPEPGNLAARTERVFDSQNRHRTTRPG